MPSDRRSSQYLRAYEAIARCLTPNSRRGPCARIGIAGGSGSGKSTVAEIVREQLHPLPVEVIKLDHFFKPENQLPKYYSHFHGEDQPDFNTPKSFRVEEMVTACRSISTISTVIFDGHFALYFEELRALMDLKCFVDADVSEMLERRTLRNLAIGYGGGPEVIAAYNRECVQPRHEEYILPTRRFADILIPNGASNEVERDEIISALCQGIRDCQTAMT